MMKPLFAASALALAAMSTAACAEKTPAAAAPSKEASLAEIKTAVEALAAAWKAKNPEAIISHFTADATFMEIGVPRMTGQTAHDYVHGVSKDPGFAMTITADKYDVSAGGDMGYVRGFFDVQYTNPETSKIEKSKGSFIAILKKQADGSWKAVEDISSPAG